MQAMTLDDYLPRLNFARLYLQQTTDNQTLPSDILLFIDKATFAWLNVFNIHNSHLSL